jgi:hypothetical protein
MTDIVSHLVTDSTNATQFSKTFIGKCFADCLKGNVHQYGIWVITNGQSEEQLRTMKDLYENTPTIWKKYDGSIYTFEGGGELAEFFHMEKLTNGSTAKITRIESPTLDVCMYMCKNIGVLIRSTLSEYGRIISKGEKGYSYITADAFRSFHENCIKDKWKQILLLMKYNKMPDMGSSQLCSLSSFNIDIRNLIFDKQGKLKITTPTDVDKLCNYIEKVLYYLLNWWETAIVEFEAKRAELHGSMNDDYDSTLSKKTMTALEEEATNCCVEVADLPRYTVDSIVRAVRRDNPRKEPNENSHLATMQQLTPYVEASCAGLIASAKQFAAEYEA